uniref:Uncharacterized protein n=1 Tax=Arundo donax TaxID=35708 RepID=A0A0A9HLX3_ARUDO
MLALCTLHRIIYADFRSCMLQPTTITTSDIFPVPTQSYQKFVVEVWR